MPGNSGECKLMLSIFINLAGKVLREDHQQTAPHPQERARLCGPQVIRQDGSAVQQDQL